MGGIWALEAIAGEAIADGSTASGLTPTVLTSDGIWTDETADRIEDGLTIRTPGMLTVGLLFVGRLVMIGGRVDVVRMAGLLLTRLLDIEGSLAMIDEGSAPSMLETTLLLVTEAKGSEESIPERIEVWIGPVALVSGDATFDAELSGTERVGTTAVGLVTLVVEHAASRPSPRQIDADAKSAALTVALTPAAGKPVRSADAPTEASAGRAADGEAPEVLAVGFAQFAGKPNPRHRDAEASARA